MREDIVGVNAISAVLNHNSCTQYMIRCREVRSKLTIGLIGDVFDENQVIYRLTLACNIFRLCLFYSTQSGGIRSDPTLMHESSYYSIKQSARNVSIPRQLAA